jgi:hypothetical protein
VTTSSLTSPESQEWPSPEQQTPFAGTQEFEVPVLLPATTQTTQSINFDNSILSSLSLALSLSPPQQASVEAQQISNVWQTVSVVSLQVSSKLCRLTTCDSLLQKEFR